MIAVSNRGMCKDGLTHQIRRIAKINKPDMLILREKDMTPEEYTTLAREVIAVCDEAGIECVLHSFIEAAIELGHKKIHLPMPLLEKYKDSLGGFDLIGASTHSIDEVRRAESLGAHYVTLSNVFETDCKPGKAAEGVVWLDEICKAVDMPIYALGGINRDNIDMIRSTSVAGACMMSGYMKI